MKSMLSRLFVLLTVLGLGLSTMAPTAQAKTTKPAKPATIPKTQIFHFPAQDTPFPEGIAKDPNSNFFYVGANANGAIYRGDASQPKRGLTLFLPGGADGRTSVTGMKVDNRGFLWICGAATGNIWMYDTRNGRLLSQFYNGVADTFINDVTITPDGTAYFTDSRTPIIYRIAPNAQGVFTFEYWRNLSDTAIPYGPGFNLNGITSTADGKYLIVVHSTTGQLFRIATDTKKVSEIPLAGDDKMTNGDGILLDGQTLYVSRNSLNLIVQLRLARNFTSGHQIGSFTDSSFRYTTTLAQTGDRLLVVNSQFDKRGPNLQPRLPFTISSVPIPVAR